MVINPASDFMDRCAGDKPVELSVVMPCLNEAETLEQCIREAQQAIADNAIVAEIIIADNGSTDGSLELAQRCGARVIQVIKKGYGSASRAGIAAAAGEYVIMGDADASYRFGDLNQFLEKLRSGFDLVMGNRFTGGIARGAMPWTHQYIGNPLLSGIGRLFFRVPIADFHCGLRAFRRDAITELNLSTDGMEFASEMVVKAKLRGLRITEVPTALRKDGRNRPPHLRSLRDGWRHLRFLLLYCPIWLYVLPALAMIVSGGTALLAFAVCGPIQIGEVTLSINTAIVCAMSVMLGNQLLLMGVFARRLGGLLNIWPPSSSRRTASLELGLCMGCGLAMLGVLGVALATANWWWHGMTPLSPRVALSVVIPSTTLGMMGVQTVFASFFLSLLGLVTPQSR